MATTSPLLMFIYVCVASHFAEGVFEITSSSDATIGETHMNFLIKNVTTNVATIPVPDGNPNVVTFQLMNQTPESMFSDEYMFIFRSNTSGELRNRVMFDYENEPEYTVVIEAVARVGGTATQTLTVDILDENEFQTWTFPSVNAFYTFDLTDGYTNNTEVLLTVNCNDEDRGQTLTYSLDDSRYLFAIDSVVGSIRLAADVTINRTMFASEHYLYTFGIIATDNGTPALSSTGTAKVTISVKPVVDDAGSARASITMVLLSLAMAAGVYIY